MNQHTIDCWNKKRIYEQNRKERSAREDSSC